MLSQPINKGRISIMSFSMTRITSSKCLDHKLCLIIHKVYLNSFYFPQQGVHSCLNHCKYCCLPDIYKVTAAGNYSSPSINSSVPFKHRRILPRLVQQFCERSFSYTLKQPHKQPIGWQKGGDHGASWTGWQFRSCRTHLATGIQHLLKQPHASFPA